MSSSAFPKVIWITSAALFFLWALSFALSYLHLGSAALPIAMIIAAVKAGLVVLFFMELAHEPLSMKLSIGAGAALLAALLGFVLVDIEMREVPPLLPFGTEIDAPPADLRP